MKLKRRDQVVVLSGKDKGKRGEVVERVGLEKFIVSKVNMVKKHKRATQSEKAGIYDQESPIHKSKLMLICSKCNSPTNPKAGFLEDGSKVRICRNCSEVIK